MVKFILHTTHGDPYYIGLNGIELYDQSGRLMAVSPDQLQAIPFRYGVLTYCLMSTDILKLWLIFLFMYALM